MHDVSVKSLLGLAAGLLLLTSCGSASDATADPRATPAPGFTVTTFDGDEFSLTEQRGTPVVLNFWESW